MEDSKKLLVVEDSKITRELIVSAIEDIGDFEIVEAGNGFEALKLLPRNRFSLILTDINMPDINGLELVKFIRSNEFYKSIPLIIISTEGSKRDREKGVALGANGYLVKPFDFNQLITRFFKNNQLIKTMQQNQYLALVQKKTINI